VILKAWQAIVEAEAAKTWTAAPPGGELKFPPINSHEGDKPPLDDDKMVKPIRDALNMFVYDEGRRTARPLPVVRQEVAAKYWRCRVSEGTRPVEGGPDLPTACHRPACGPLGRPPLDDRKPLLGSPSR
jgi:hypothetical protein